MGQAFDTQLILALVIVVIAIGAFGFTVYIKFAEIGLLRDDFDRRAPWLAFGVILGGALLYYLKS